MTFKVFAGTFYCGKLHVFPHTQAWFPVQGDSVFTDTTPVAKVKGYTHLKLVRIL